MAAYYNEHDRFAAAWLRELIKAGLIADGDVDERSIEDVRPDDLRGFVQCHFFAGIGGWSHALRLAGWPDDEPCWTFSCPCQFKSSASRGRTVARDLWPEQRRLMLASGPGVFFGEQVSTAVDWFDGLCADVEAVGYEIGAAVLSSLGVGADHIRPRLYFVGHADRNGQSGLPVDAEVARLPIDRGDAGALVSADGVSERLVALSGFGNAIDPRVAQVFIEAYCDVRGLSVARPPGDG